MNPILIKNMADELENWNLKNSDLQVTREFRT